MHRWCAWLWENGSDQLAGASQEEERDIRKVADVFGIKKTFADKVMGFFDRRLTRINIFVKNIVDKLNAKSK